MGTDGHIGHRMLLSVTLCFSANNTLKNDFCALFLAVFVTHIQMLRPHPFEDDQHPLWDVTFPYSSRAASTGISHARAHTRSSRVAHRRSSALGPSLLPMSGSQPSPNRTTSRLPAMEGTALLLIPDLGRHPALTRPLAG